MLTDHCVAEKVRHPLDRKQSVKQQRDRGMVVHCLLRAAEGVELVLLKTDNVVVQ